MNVAYLLKPTPDPQDDVVHRSPALTAVRNPDLLPHAYVVYQTCPASTPEHALSLLAAPDFDPAREVILERGTSQEYSVSDSVPALHIPQPETRTAEHGTRNTQPATRNPQPATLLPSPPNQVTIRAVLPQTGVLVLADTAYPGWQATVDGRAVEVYRANYAYRALRLDAGAHEVVFRYRPLSVRVGAWISALSGLGVLAAAVSSWKKRTAKTGEHGSCLQMRREEKKEGH
jgi:hypothetical protein